MRFARRNSHVTPTPSMPSCTSWQRRSAHSVHLGRSRCFDVLDQLASKVLSPIRVPTHKKVQNPGPGQQQQQQMKTNTCPTLNSTCGSKYLLIFQWTLLTLQSVRVMPCCFVKTGATVTGRALDLTPFRNRLLQKPKLSNPKFLNEPTPNPCRALLSLRNPLKEA